MTSPNPYTPPRAAVLDPRILGEHESIFDYLMTRASLGEIKGIVTRTGWLLIGTPVLLFGLGVLGGILSLVYDRTDNRIYELGVLLCLLLGLSAALYMIGRSAALLGSRWLVLLVLTIFIGPTLIVSWLMLFDKHLKLRACLASRMLAKSGEAERHVG